MAIVKWCFFWAIFALGIAALHIYKPFATWGLDRYVIVDPQGTSTGVLREARADSVEPPVESVADTAPGNESRVVPEAESEQAVAASTAAVQQSSTSGFELGLAKPEQIAKLAREALAAEKESESVDRVPESSQQAPVEEQEDVALSGELQESDELPETETEEEGTTADEESNAASQSNAAAITDFSTPQIYETTTPLNFRAGPGRDYRLLGTLEGATRVQVVAEENGWFRIRTKNDSPAYVRAKYLIPID